MLFTQNSRRVFMVGALCAGSFFPVQASSDSLSGNDLSARIDVNVATSTMQLQPTKKSASLTSKAATVVSALFHMGIGMAGVVAIIDALSNRSGALMATEAGLGLIVFFAAFVAPTSGDVECSITTHDCCTHADYCYDCYDHGYYYHDPVIVYDPVIIQHDHIEIIEPTIIQPVLVQAPVEQPTEVALQPTAPAESHVNADNAEVNNFWNDPFNY